MNGIYQPLKKNQTSYEDAGLPMKEYVPKAYGMIAKYKKSLENNPMCTSVSCFYPEGIEDKAS